MLWLKVGQAEIFYHFFSNRDQFQKMTDEAFKLGVSLRKATRAEKSMHADLRFSAKAAIKQIRADCNKALHELEARKKQAIRSVRGYMKRIDNQKRRYSHEEVSPELAVAKRLLASSAGTGAPSVPQIISKARARLTRIEDRLFDNHFVVPQARQVDKPLYELIEKIFALEHDPAPFSGVPGQSDPPLFVQSDSTIANGPVYAQHYDFASNVSPHAGAVVGVDIGGTCGRDRMALFWQEFPGLSAERMEEGVLIFDSTAERMYLCSYGSKHDGRPPVELNPAFTREGKLRFGGIADTHFSVVTVGHTPKVTDVPRDWNMRVVSYLCSPTYDVHYQLAQQRASNSEPAGFSMLVNNKPVECYRDDGGLCEKLDQVPMCQWPSGEHSTPAWENVFECVLVMLPGRLMCFRAGPDVSTRNFTAVRGGTDVPIAVEPRDTICEFDHNNQSSVFDSPAPLQMCRVGDILVILCDGEITTRRITADGFGLVMTRTNGIDEHLKAITAAVLRSDRILHISNIDCYRFAIMTKHSVLNVRIEQDQ